MVPFVKSSSSSKEPLSKKPVMFVKASTSPEREASGSPEKPASNQILSFIKAVRDDKSDETDGEEHGLPESQRTEPATVDKCLSLIKSMRGGDGDHREHTPVKAPASERVEKYKKAVQQNSRQKITYPDSEEPSYNSIGRGVGRGSFRSQRGRTSSNAGGQSRNR